MRNTGICGYSGCTVCPQIREWENDLNKLENTEEKLSLLLSETFHVKDTFYSIGHSCKKAISSKSTGEIGLNLLETDIPISEFMFKLMTKVRGEISVALSEINKLKSRRAMEHARIIRAEKASSSSGSSGGSDKADTSSYSSLKKKK